MTGFVVLGLPRSRTAWLSQFLSVKDWYCGHDQLRYMRSLDDIKAWLAQPNTGSCETAGAPFWRLLVKYAPDIKIVTVRRPVEDVVDSLRRVGMTTPPEVLRKGLMALDRKLDQIEGRVPGVLATTFEALETEATCKMLFEHCLPYAHDHCRWVEMSRRNIQINFPALQRYVNANLGEINRLSSVARETMLKDLSVARGVEGEIVIREESIDALCEDGEGVMRRHCAQIGETAGNWMAKNIPLMRILNRAGYMQVMVARCNGKIFGYLGSVIAPSLESNNWLMAEHGMFYAAEEFPGLGLKLQRAALRSLRSRGVREVFMRAGTRGDGPRLGTLYRRVGAVDFGKVYRVNLEA